jgi:hypothetical protein
MHSEVFVRFKDEIRVEHLMSELPAASDAGAVLAETHFRMYPEIISSAVYARSEAKYGYIVFTDDGRSIRLYAEGRANKGNLKDLMRRSEQLADSFIRAGRAYGYRLDCALISLYADDYFITAGYHRTFGQRLLTRFADTIFGDVVVGLFTCVLTGLLIRQWAAGVVAGTASVLCFLAWLAIEIGGQDEYEYGRF